MKNALLIANANAGTADHENIEAAISALRGSFEIRVTETGTPIELDAAIELRVKDEMVIIADGDGSLHAVIRSLYDAGNLQDVVLGLIPLGTGNDFARGASVSLDPAEAAQGLRSGTEDPVDLVIDDAGGIAINAVHLGASAEAGDAAQSWKSRLGKVGCVFGALVAGFSKQGLHERIEVDGAEVSHSRVASVAINNGPFVGGGTRLGTGADPASGLLHIHVSHAYGPLSRLGYAFQVRLGSHVKRQDVVALRGHSISVSGEPFTYSADGEIEGNISGRTWTVRPGAVRMLLTASPTEDR